MRSCMLLLVAALLIAGSAFAQPGAECTVWSMDTTGATPSWVQNDPAVDSLYNARLFRTGEAWEGNCNKEVWEHTFVIHASVATWIDFTVDNARWDWYIRKPGTYAGDGIKATIASNGDIQILFDGFENLAPDVDHPDANPLTVHYGFSAGDGDVADPNLVTGWYTPEELNASEDTWLYEADNENELHWGVTWRLWNKIQVVACNAAAEYEDEATITLTLDQQKDWIDAGTGDWNL